MKPEDAAQPNRNAVRTDYWARPVRTMTEFCTLLQLKKPGDKFRKGLLEPSTATKGAIGTTLGLPEGSRWQTNPFAEPLQQRRLRQFNRAAKIDAEQARHAAFLHGHAIKPMHPPHRQRVVRDDQEARAAFRRHGIQQIA